MRVLVDFFKNKRNLVTTIILLLLIAAVPLAVNLSLRSQIFKPRAFGETIQLVEDPCLISSNPNRVGCETFPIKLTSPFGVEVATPSASPSVSPSPSPSPSPTFGPNLLQNPDFAGCNSTGWTQWLIGNVITNIATYPGGAETSGCYVAFNCNATSPSNACDGLASIFQDVSVTGLGGKTIHFGGKFATTVSPARVGLAVFELDVQFGILGKHVVMIEGTTTFQDIDDSFVVNASTKTLRYQLYPVTGETFKGDNLFLKQLTSVVVSPSPSPSVSPSPLPSPSPSPSPNLSFSYGVASNIPVTGSWTGSAQSGIAVISGDTWYIRNSPTPGAIDYPAFSYGVSGNQFIAGDWDGDGKGSIGIMWDSGKFLLRDSISAGSPTYNFEITGVPAGGTAVVGDWDGDGKTSVGVFAQGKWYLKNSFITGGADLAFDYGVNGNSPVTGKWNGGSKTGIGVVNGNDWYLRNTPDAGAADYHFTFGQIGQTPITGDWDGDGKTSVGMFKDGNWVLTNSLTTPTLSPSLAPSPSPIPTPIPSPFPSPSPLPSPSPSPSPFASPTFGANLLQNPNFAGCNSTGWTQYLIGNVITNIATYPGGVERSGCFMAFNCNATNPANACNEFASVYQDINATGLGGKKLIYGGKVATTNNPAQVIMVVFELDTTNPALQYGIITSHAITINANTTYKDVSDSFVVNTNTRILRYQLYPKTGETFKADNLFISEQTQAYAPLSNTWPSLKKLTSNLLTEIFPNFTGQVSAQAPSPRSSPSAISSASVQAPSPRSSPSAISSASVAPIPPGRTLPVVPPSSVTATALDCQNSKPQVKITWVQSQTDLRPASFHKIERTENGTAWDVVGYTDGNVGGSDFTDTSAKENAWFAYRVSAAGTSSNPGYSAPADSNWVLTKTCPVFENTFTLKYRLAGTQSDLSSKPLLDYSTHPIITNFTLSSSAPGQNQIWVEFIDNNNQSYIDHISVELVAPAPTISGLSCTLDLNKKSLKFTLDGVGFGSSIGQISANGSPVPVLSWGETQVIGSIENPTQNFTEGQQFSVKLSSSDARNAAPVICRVDTALLSLGARLFCREPGKFDVTDVSVILVDSNGSKVEEKVSIDKDGLIANLKTRLQAGKLYSISIKAPGSLRRTALFTAQEGTSVVSEQDFSGFILPVGDIAPVFLVDGKINTVDRAELTRQWTIIGSGPKRSGDLNRDTKVNSIDWACMRYDFNQEDSKIPAKAELPPVPIPPPPAPPLGSPSPVACPTAPTCQAGKTLLHGDPLIGGCAVYACVDGPTSQRVAYFLLGPQSTGSYSLNQEFGFDIRVWSQNEAVNVAAAKLTFDPEAIEVVRIEKGTTFNSWAEEFFDNLTGNISLVSGIPNPGIKTTQGNDPLLARVIFKGKKIGNTNIAVSSESRIFSNADSTNILGSLVSSQIAIVQ